MIFIKKNLNVLSQNGKLFLKDNSDDNDNYWKIDHLLEQ